MDEYELILAKCELVREWKGQASLQKVMSLGSRNKAGMTAS